MRVATENEIRKGLVPNHSVGSLPAFILQSVLETRALLTGHFELMNGEHAPHFLRFAQLGWNRALTATIAEELLSRTRIPIAMTQLLCSESSGVFLADAIARARRVPLAVTTVDGRRRPQPFMREGRLNPNQPVVIVNDIAAWGETMRRLRSLAQESGAPVAGVLAFGAIKPGEFTDQLGEHSLQACWLLDAKWPTFPADACPLCSGPEPLVSAAEFT